MSQLESMKYLSPEMLGQTAEPVAAAEATSAPQPASTGRLATASDLGMAQWTITLSVVMGLMTILGGWGLIGGVIELIGLATLESNLALLEKLGGYGADVAATSAMIETQIENRLFLYLVAGIRILTGVAFLGAVAMMKTKKPDANRFAALVCVGAVFYNMLVVLGVWICIPANIPGLPEGAGTGVAMMAVIFALVWFGVKAAIYGGLIAYLMNKNNCALFVPRPASERLF